MNEYYEFRSKRIKELDETFEITHFYGDDYPENINVEVNKIIKNEWKLNNLQSKIDKANEILEEILVVSDWEHEGRFRPVKGTTAQDVYKTIVKLNELLETPSRTNYELLKEDK